MNRGKNKEMQRLFKLKYPKITLLIIFIGIAYLLFSNLLVLEWVSHLDSLKYLGILIAGILFSFGFTTPFAIGFFIIVNPENLLLASLVGGIGAMISDLFIFKIIKYSFIDEFNQLQNSNPIKKINRIINKNIPQKIKIYLLYAFSGLIIASPLPDEVGVTMLAGLSNIRTITLMIVSFFANTIGILVMLAL